MSLLYRLLYVAAYLELVSFVESFQLVSLTNMRYQNSIHTKRLLAVNDSDGAKRKRSIRPRSSKRRSINLSKEIKNPDDVETWRIYGVDVSPDSLAMGSNENIKEVPGDTKAAPPETTYLTAPVIESLLSRLRIKVDDSRSNGFTMLPPDLIDARVIRRSLDARRRRASDPKYTYVIDVDITKGNARKLKFVHQPGRMERTKHNPGVKNRATSMDMSDIAGRKSLPRVVIVGAGPAGLFCALSLASSGFKPIILERGQPVEARGKSIGALIHRRSIDPESNFSFGEGGAGTWSDGKLTTRIGRNSEPVRFVLETLVKYGAPPRILVEGSPHLGTDNLVRLLRNMRADIQSLGGEFHFECRASKFHIKDRKISSLDAENNNDKASHNANHSVSFNDLDAGAVVLATGHSARDVYEELAASGVQLEAKGFAVGFRIEHPQRIINEIQYGEEWGNMVRTNRLSTDDANKRHFDSIGKSVKHHSGILPVPSYKLATDEAFDGVSNRGAYSFCMCPGGQIVPSATEEGELCINGMSFSKRDSIWANSACVVTISPDDPILDEYRINHGELAGLEFQREMERKAWVFGGANFTCPVQRLTDFVDGKISSTIPKSSYRLGVRSAACHEIYPEPLYNSLKYAITHHFERQMPGFLTSEALIHGVETRTSSPVRVARDPKTLQAMGLDNLFPAGEGAGFAGGIVSAAVDGMAVAESVKKKILQRGDSLSDVQTIGFHY